MPDQPTSLLDSNFLFSSPNLDPTICLCDCHDQDSDLSRNSKIKMVRHLVPCCSSCDGCGALIMIHRMEVHKASYCGGNAFNNRKV